MVELVIKIPKEIQLALINNIQLSIDQQSICDSCIKQAIINGTPLPKGHGRIIDESEITKCEQVGLIIKGGNITRCLVTDAPTIIESDNVESDE